MGMGVEDNIFIACAVFIGLLVGSFLNVVIFRVPKILERQWLQAAKETLELPLSGEEQVRFNLLTPASECRTCHTPIKPWCNIPILSFLMLKGRCKACKTPISYRYPLIEALSACIFGLVAWKFGWGFPAFGALIFSAFLIAATFIDADTQLLPDQLTLPLLWLGLLFNLDGTYVSLSEAVLGAVVGYMSLWTIFQLFKLITQKEGMGYGDFKLLAALGAWLGLNMLPLIILCSALVGLVFAIVMRLTKDQPMPFGPYLAVAGWLALMFQHPLQEWLFWWLTKSGF